jgi:hypothetical protein
MISLYDIKLASQETLAFAGQYFGFFEHVSYIATVSRFLP